MCEFRLRLNLHNGITQNVLPYVSVFCSPYVYVFIHGVLYSNLFAHMTSVLFDILLYEYSAIYQFWC